MKSIPAWLTNLRFIVLLLSVLGLGIYLFCLYIRGEHFFFEMEEYGVCAFFILAIFIVGWTFSRE